MKFKEIDAGFHGWRLYVDQDCPEDVVWTIQRLFALGMLTSSEEDEK